MPWHAADVPGAREIAVLVACERLVQRWPDAARIAFRKAVLADVESFSSGVWDPIAPQIKAEMYYARWQLGLPWPPGPNELRVVTAEVAYDRDEVSALAARIRAVGLPLALASR